MSLTLEGTHWSRSKVTEHFPLYHHDPGDRSSVLCRKRIPRWSPDHLMLQEVSINLSLRAPRSQLYMYVDEHQWNKSRYSHGFYGTRKLQEQNGTGPRNNVHVPIQDLLCPVGTLRLGNPD